MTEVWIMCIDWICFPCHYLIQAADEVLPIEGADMKSGSEGLRNMNYGQENYDGMTILFLHSNGR